MAIELAMPALSPSMEKGTLARWLVAEGDRVTIGDQLAEIETDKATMELEAEHDGRVAKLIVAEGTSDVAVGTVIAFLTTGSDNQKTASQIDEATQKPAATLSPAALPKRGEQAERIKVSPLAQRVAEIRGIDLTGIEGTGPNGRIVRADLCLPPLGTIPSEAAATVIAAAPLSIAPPRGLPVQSIPLSAMRKTIARRLSESKQTIPHFYLTVRCNLDALLDLRAKLNESLASRDIKVSVNDMLIKALAMALLRVPDANVQFGGDVLHRFSRVDIAMAVAIDGGLVTPVITDAGNRSLSNIANTSRALAAKARDGKLALEDYQGGTASISNLGMFGIDEMVPVINPPQALIMGIGSSVEQPWKVDGGIALAKIMAATASFDHRAIDGATAAQFMNIFQELVERPLQIVS